MKRAVPGDTGDDKSPRPEAGDIAFYGLLYALAVPLALGLIWAVSRGMPHVVAFALIASVHVPAIWYERHR